MSVRMSVSDIDWPISFAGSTPFTPTQPSLRLATGLQGLFRTQAQAGDAQGKDRHDQRVGRRTLRHS